MTVLVDLQNPCGFKGLPNIEDVQRWIEVALKDEENQAVSVVVRVVDTVESAALKC